MSRSKSRLRMGLSCNDTHHTKRCILAKNAAAIELWIREEIVAFVAITKPSRSEHKKADASDSHVIAVFFEVRSILKTDSMYIGLHAVHTMDDVVKVGLNTVDIARKKL